MSDRNTLSPVNGFYCWDKNLFDDVEEPEDDGTPWDDGETEE